MPFTIIDSGTFTSTGVGVKIPLPADADRFVTINHTQSATTQNPGRMIEAEWRKNVTASDNARRVGKLNSANTTEVTLVTSGGFKYVASPPLPETELTGTTITAANPAVASVANSYSNGDRVRIYDSTGMLQIGGMDFTVSSVSGSAVTLAGLDASGFAAAATAFKIRRISDDPAVAPEFLYVTNITQAASAVVTVSTAHSYVVGQKIHLSVPSSFGMVEADQLDVEITAVGTYTLTVDLDSTGFTAFAFPTSASSPTSRLFATASPAGSRNIYDVTNVPFRTDQFYPYMYLAAGAQSPAGSNNDVIEWIAYKNET
ncbi:MAG: hypothetical protein PQJ44_06890 [Sphaerochaetaceae bacterium]|nr:hypothetical protein [Sphaerochaetaceae bacterium]